MRKALLLAVAVVLSASSAQAQRRDRDHDDDSWSDRREYRDERGRGRDDDDGWREERRDHFGRRGGGARFFLRSGETRLGAVCDPRESMRSCVDAALTLLERAKQAGSAAPSPTTSGSSPPNARP